MTGKNYAGIWFYTIVAGIFFLIVSRNAFSDGMFSDGLLYATLSKNLAHGIGTFWKPHMTDTLFPVFINHPPLQFGIESIFFRIFGDGRLVERTYSLLCIIITSGLTAAIWKSSGKKISEGWMPIMIWIIIPSVSWAAVNNMLENTMGVFICLSVLFYLMSLKNHRYMFLIAGGAFLSLGFLTKGFVTFFPLSFPFFHWLFIRRRSFFKMAGDTLTIFASALIPLIAVYTLLPGAKEVLPGYLEITFGLVAENATKESRFYILYRLFMELLPAAIILILFLLYCKKKNISSSTLKNAIPQAAVFFCIGLSGVLPIMITKTQSGYYLLTSLPFFVLSFASLAEQPADILLSRINFQSVPFRYFKICACVIFALGIGLSAAFSVKPHRDKNKLSDTRIVLTAVEPGSTINILPDMYYDWPMHGYYGRYGNISLDPDLNARHKFLLVNNSLYSDTLLTRYEESGLPLSGYRLLVRKDER